MFEIRNEKEAYDIRRWQLGERPGEYKHHDYVTGKEEIGVPLEDVQEIPLIYRKTGYCDGTGGIHSYLEGETPICFLKSREKS